LPVTLEAAKVRHAVIQGLFAIMAEWWMAQVMRERRGLYEISVDWSFGKEGLGGAQFDRN